MDCFASLAMTGEEVGTQLAICSSRHPMAELLPSNTKAEKPRSGGTMSISRTAPGVVGPLAGLDVPWLLRMRSQSRRDHRFLIWALFDAPARSWSYGEFHERVGALAAGLVKRGVRPGENVPIISTITSRRCSPGLPASNSAPSPSPPTPAR